MKYAITYTKHFVPGSVLEGIEYTEVEKDLELHVTLHTVKWCQDHRYTPVTAYDGSDYTITDYDVAITEL